MKCSTGFHSGAWSLVSFEAALAFGRLEDCLEALTRCSRLEHISLVLELKDSGRTTFPCIWCTIPGQLLARCMRLSHATYNPIQNIGFSSKKPFFWTDLWSDERAVAFLSDVAEHGIGPSGYSVPLDDQGRSRALFSFTSSSMEEDDWRYYIEAIQHELLQFCWKAYGQALDEILVS